MPVKKFFGQIIDHRIEQINTMGGRLDKFFGPHFVPKPAFDEQDMEKKVVPYLRTLDTTKLGKQKAIHHQAFVFASALYETEPNKRHSVELPYSILWKRYTW